MHGIGEPYFLKKSDDNENSHSKSTKHILAVNVKQKMSEQQIDILNIYANILHLGKRWSFKRGTTV